VASRRARQSDYRKIQPMPLLRLAYVTQFLIALLSVYTIWAQVGGQSHIDLMPWYLKLGLGLGAAFAIVKATAAAVSNDHAWNGGTLKWVGITIALLIGCGLASYYFHIYGEEDENDSEDEQTSWVLPLQKPDGVIQKLSVHLPARGTVCNS
jgi:hypothetical protein